MRRLTVYLVLFGVLVSLPLVFVAWRTFAAIDREAEAQVRFFADRLLDGMENELAEMVRREEGRAVDAYRHQVMMDEGPRVSPLAGEPAEPFILGYLQNNPDGTFQTPLVDDPQAVPAALTERVAQLESANRQFNQRKRTALPPSASVEPPAEPAVAEKKEQTVFADRFLNPPALEKSKRKLGQEEARVEEITAGQAMNLARQEPERTVASTSGGAASEAESDAAGSSRYDWRSAESAPAVASARRRQAAPSPSSPDAGGRFQAEVAPLQAVSIDGQTVFVFRRIGINGQIYRQGVVLRLQPFLDHLLTRHYDDQPIARYTRLTLTAADVSVARDGDPTAAGPGGGTPLTARVFPAPFGFLSAEMALITLPASPARRTLTLALAVLGLVLVAGLVAIFFSTRAVFDLSERRSRFVSAVTHELKTPLTNIRLYIDMLDQGIAATPEREQEYLGILSSESARLSNLINNVLELSRLEKQSRRFDLVEGDLKIQGDFSWYGPILVTGSVMFTDGGNKHLTGALIVGGSATIGVFGGNVSIVYCNSAIVGHTANSPLRYLSWKEDL